MIVQEAIKHCEEKAKEKYAEGMLCHANPNDDLLDGCIKCAKEHEQLAEWLKELEQYRALGTVEELKEAREKQIPKKPLKVKGDCYSKAKDGTELYEVLLICPTCKSQVLVNPLPCKCGQMIDWKDISKLDWSEEDV